MTLTCPFYHSRARLSPNPAHAERNSLPVYILTCSGCEHTRVRATLVPGQLATTNASGA